MLRILPIQSRRLTDYQKDVWYKRFYQQMLINSLAMDLDPDMLAILSKNHWMNEWMNEWMIYLMSKMWEVFQQSSEPEAHVKNARQSKNYKTR